MTWCVVVQQWVEHVELKAPLFDAVSLLYRGMQAEELQRMGERIAFYHAASEKLAEAFAVAKRIGGPEGKVNAAPARSVRPPGIVDKADRIGYAERKL